MRKAISKEASLVQEGREREREREREKDTERERERKRFFVWGEGEDEYEVGKERKIATEKGDSEEKVCIM